MSSDEIWNAMKVRFPNLPKPQPIEPKGILYRYREDYRNRETAPVYEWPELIIRLAAWATVRDRKIDRVGDELPERCGSWSEESYHLVAKFLASFESKRVREFDANDMRYVAAVVRRLNGDER
jgi:hypothetical protein